MSRDRIVALVDEIADAARMLVNADPSDLAKLYHSLSLSMVYHHHKRAVDIPSIPSLGVDLACPRGTHALTTRIDLISA